MVKHLFFAHKTLSDWIEQMQALCAPEALYLCKGGDEEWKELCQKAVQEGLLIPLNPEKRPESFLARSDPDDVARVESRTFVSAQTKEIVGANNNFLPQEELAPLKQKLFSSSMQGRTMYIVPFSMGHPDSAVCRIGVLLTDSSYVALSMHIMTRVGSHILDKLGEKGDFIPCLHSVGVPLKEGEKGPRWPCRKLEERYIVHDLCREEIFSFGSGYGGNALLGKKCLALRLASFDGKDKNQYAEHMLLSTFISPQGEKVHIAAAFPSACGKTNFAMMQPSLPGWKTQCLGDDIAWMWWKEGRLHAINPEMGFFGVAPGTSWKTNRDAMEAISRRTIFTNVGLTPDFDVWWEGLSDQPPEGTIDWLGKLYDGTSKVAHPNARYTVSILQCPSLHPSWNDPDGICIDAILFGGRRLDTIPLVTEARNWKEGVLMGALLASETTAASEAKVGQLRHDPFAMLPFCGYNLKDYFAHHLAAEIPGRHMPKHYLVNWFRKNGKALWPGFGDNIRVVKWILERIQGRCSAIEGDFGLIPSPSDFDLSGLACRYEDLFVDSEEKILANREENKNYLRSLGALDLVKIMEAAQEAASFKDRNVS